MKSRCDDCLYASQHHLVYHPNHLVHPETMKPMVYDIYGEAVCPECGSVWRRGTNNDCKML